MLIPLSATALFGKASSGEDFDLLACTGGEVSRAVQSVAASWLQVFLNTENRTVVALQIVAGDWWIVRAVPERTEDAAGRPRAFVVFGRLSEPPAPALVPNLLLNFARLELQRSTKLPEAIETTPVTAVAPSGKVASAAVALALGNDVTTGGKLDLAAAILEVVTLPGLAWVALIPKQRPAELPLGPGLVISNDVVSLPSSSDEIVAARGAGQLLALPLAQLAQLPDGPAVRERLLHAALGIPLESTSMVLSEQAIAWLTCTPAGREAALTALQDFQLGFWFTSPFACAEDVSRLASRLKPEHQKAVYALLKGSSAAFQLYARAYPSDAAGLATFVPDRLARTLRMLHTSDDQQLGGEPDGPIPRPSDRGGESLRHAEALQPRVEDLDELLRFLEGSSVLQNLPLAARATAARSGHPTARRMYAEELVRQGLPQGVVRAILGGDVPTTTPELTPELEPNIAWLRAVDAESLLRLGHCLCSAPSWRNWWLRAVEILYRTELVGRDVVFRSAVELRQAKLLALVAAPQTVCTLADPSGGRVTLPPPSSEWESAADPLLDQLLLDRSLLDRIEPPLTESAWSWVEERIVNSERRQKLCNLRLRLTRGDALSAKWLERHARLLSRGHVLGQIAAWAQAPLQPDRRHVLEHLLRLGVLGSEERDWLSTLTLSCGPLGTAPQWSADDLSVLLPVLDPVRDVLRAMLARPTREPGEEALLGKLVVLLTNRCTPAPAPASDSERSLRPDWVTALGRVPGWGGFATEDGQSLLQDVKLRSRQLLHLKGDALSGPVKTALITLAQEDTQCSAPKK